MMAGESKATSLVEGATTEIEDAFRRHERAVLGFSGGKDSITLAHLCRPFRDQLQLVWVNTGAMFPHMVEFVRAYGAEWDLVEIRTDQVGYTATHGLPADLVPALNMPGLAFTTNGGERRPRGVPIQSFAQCCSVLRSQPLVDYARISGASLLLIGQRYDEHSPFPEGILPAVLPYGPIEVVWPLREWSTDDVMAYIAAHSLKLPEQYPEVMGSLECANCSADLTAERLLWMRRRYPEIFEEVKSRVAAIHSASLAQVREMAPAMQELNRADGAACVLGEDERDGPRKAAGG